MRRQRRGGLPPREMPLGVKLRPGSVKKIGQD